MNLCAICIKLDCPIAFTREVPYCEDYGPISRADLRSAHAQPINLEKGLPQNYEQLQKLLNKAFRKGNQSAHDAHFLAARCGISAAQLATVEFKLTDDGDLR